ncbi:MAG TPA: recombination-associated protein RdgC [Fluviicoccus sp.]|nr:recombination-associated protein RdgC [Fluviicoccus sp.]
MWFKQLSIFVLGEPVDTAALAEQLEKRPFNEPAGLDWFSQGWVKSAAHLELPVFTMGAHALVCQRRDDKVLPAGVIREATDKKVAQIEAQEMRKVGRKERLSLKEQITDDLLPRAFTRAAHTHAYLDQARGFLLVDSATATKAERLVSELREALPPFPCAIPRTKIAPHALMTDWLAAGEAANGFELDSDATLKDGSENGAKVKVSRADLTAEEIRQHIATGKQVTELGLIYRERIRFVLTDQLQLKRLQFLDVLQEEAAQAGDDMATLFEATFLLMAEELGELVTDLIATMGGLDTGN